MRRATVAPSSSGRWRSSSTTSGTSMSMRSIPSRPLGAVPTTSMPSTNSNSWLNPSQTTGWSSTISTRTPISESRVPAPHDPVTQEEPGLLRHVGPQDGERCEAGHARGADDERPDFDTPAPRERHDAEHEGEGREQIPLGGAEAVGAD